MGSVNMMNLLLQGGAHINYICNNGRNGKTPLSMAACIGNQKIVEILIERGANINATNNDGDSALNLAAEVLNDKHLCHLLDDFEGIRMNTNRADQENIMKLLIANGSDINHKGVNGKTALMSIVRKGRTKRKKCFLYYFDIIYFVAKCYTHFRLM